MAGDRSSGEEEYFRIIAKYREEREEAEEEEARFKEDLETALALSLDSRQGDTVGRPPSEPEAVDTGQDTPRKPATKNSRRNRRFLPETVDAEFSATNYTAMSSEEDEPQYHPSGRRKSIEIAKEMRRKAMEEEEEEARRPHASGRRRSIEIAEEMRREIQDDDLDFHPSGGRRRSVELAQRMQRQMLNENQNGDEEYEPSVRRRSIELAEQAQALHASQSTSSFNDEEDISREIQELMRKGIIPSDHQRRSARVQDNDGELFGYGDLSPGDHRVVSASGRKKTIPQRHIIDFKNPFPFDVDGFPVNWEKSMIPDFKSEDLFIIVELLPGEDEYETIARDFHIADLEVKKIERLQNPHLLERYKAEKELLMKRRGRDFDVNARYLYHGSASEKVVLCEEGLDARLGMSGCFGRGIYFSDNPKKCVQYVSRSDVPYILMCRVMLGDAKIYQQGEMDRSLKREPEKENPTAGNKYYDSVRGRPVDFNEFVVYENRRAMIEYIITFHKKGKPIDNYTSSNQVGGAVAANAIVEESIEDHMKRIQQVREEIRQTRAAERGEVYTGPTAIQRQKDRDVWRRVLKVTCPPGTAGYSNVKGIYEYLDEEEKKDLDQTASKTVFPGATHRLAETNNNNEFPDHDLDRATAQSLVETENDDSIQLVMHHMVADFMAVTATDNVQMAKMYIEKAAMNLDQAILLYYEEEAS